MPEDSNDDLDALIAEMSPPDTKSEESIPPKKEIKNPYKGKTNDDYNDYEWSDNKKDNDVDW